MTRGDFSRFTFESSHDYAAVVVQQGRLLTDADLNEQQAIVAHRLATTTYDLAGPTGAPSHHPGFGIRAHAGLTFTPETASVSVPLEGYLWSSEPVTVEFWCQPEPGADTTLLRVGDRKDPYLTVGIEQSGSLVAVIETAGGSDGGTQGARPLNALAAIDDLTTSLGTVVLRSQPPSRQRIHHVAVEIIPGEQALLVVDGRVEDAASVALPQEDSQLPSLEFGYLDRDYLHPGTTPHDSGVRLEQVLLFTRRRSQRDVERALTAGAPSNDDPDLIGWWPLAFVTDGTVPDSGPNHLTGSLSPAGASEPNAAKPVAMISAGRYYVAGLPVTNPDELDVGNQPDAPAVSWPPKQPGWHLAYLDVWERTLTDDEQPGLADPALGGADTSVRLQTIGQVRLDPIADDPRSSMNGVDALAAKWHAEASTQAAFRSHNEIVDNRFLRVEVHEPGPIAVSRDQAVQAHAGSSPGTVILDSESDRYDDIWRSGGAAIVFAGDEPALCRIRQWDPKTRELLLADAPHDLQTSGDPRVAPVGTFKWSSNNASSSAPVHTVTVVGDRSQIGLYDWGQLRDSLRVGDWIEIATRSTMLNNTPLPLAQVTSIEADPPMLTVDHAFDDVGLDDAPEHAIVIRWDGEYPRAMEPSWVPLDQSVEVRFDGGAPTAGTYWQCATREATNRVEWPAVDGEPLLLSAAGPQHARALLAFVHWDGSVATTIDARRIFEPTPSWFPGRDAAGAGLATASARIAGHEVDLVAGAMADDGDPGPGRGELPTDPGLPEPPDPPPPGDDTALPELTLANDGVSVEGYVPTGMFVKTQPDVDGWRTRRIDGLERPPSALHWIESQLVALDDQGTISRWDDAARAWTAVNQLAPRRHFATAVLDGWLHVLGGIDSSGLTTAHTRAAVNGSGQQEELAALPWASRNLMATDHSLKIHVVGGRQRWGRLRRTHTSYSQDSDSWSPAVALPHGLADSVLVSTPTALVLPGGAKQFLFFFRLPTPNVLMLEDDAERWSYGPELHHRRRALGAGVVPNAFVAAGGRGWFGIRRASTEMFDGGAGWRDWDRLPQRAARPAIAVGPNSAIASFTGGDQPSIAEAAFASQLQVLRRAFDPEAP